MRTVILLAVLAAGLQAQEPLPFELDPQRALDHVAALASDFFAGRHSGFPGGARAEDYCARYMEDIGLAPLGSDGYYQAFTYPVARSLPPVRLGAPDGTGEDLQLHADYELLLYTGARRVAPEAPVEIVFVGYGIHEPEKGWDDYAGVDVEGKVVLCIRGVPVEDRQRFPQQRQIGYKSSTASDLGAVGMLMAEGDRAITGTIQARYHREGLAGFWISRGAMDRFLADTGHTLESVTEKIRKEQAPCSFAVPHTVSFEVNAEFLPQATARNVLGLLPGSTMPDQFILIGAHLDHLGTGPDGEVFNGADDNASGTATVLELARAFVRGGVQPARSIIFAAWAAEEQGLVGSAHYATNPTVPLEGIVAVLNLDMVGQGDGGVNVGGLQRFPWFREHLEGFQPPPVEAAEEQGWAWGSDHQSFQLKGIPAVSFSSRGRHPTYHQPSDDTGGIQPGCLAAVGNHAGALALHLAGLEAELTIPRRLQRYQAEGLTRVDTLTWGEGHDVALLAQVRQDRFTALHVRVSDLDALEALLELQQAHPEEYRICRTPGDIRRLGRALGLFLEPAGELADRQALLTHLPVIRSGLERLELVDGASADLTTVLQAAVTASGADGVHLQLLETEDPVQVLVNLISGGWTPEGLRALVGGNLLRRLGAVPAGASGR